MKSKTGTTPRSNKPSPRKALGVPCPTCGVAAGKHCIDLGSSKIPRKLMQDYLKAGYDTEPMAAPAPHGARQMLAAVTPKKTTRRPS